MRMHRWLIPTAASLVIELAAVLLLARSSTVHADSPALCDMRVDVVLTPDVPDPRNPAFLSSLLSNHPGYRLLLLRQTPGSGLVLDLSGPGPEYRCANVIETIRRDGRVLSVDEARDPPDDELPVAIVTAPSEPEARPKIHLSLAGLGSLVWAARDPAQAWKVIAPIEPGGVAYADIRERCAAYASASNSDASCP